MDELRAEGHAVAEPAVAEMSFPSRTEAVTYMFRHQNGQRNLTPLEAAKAFLRQSDVVADLVAAASARRKLGKKAKGVGKGRVVDIVAAQIGVGRTTVYHAMCALKAEEQLSAEHVHQLLAKYPKLAKSLESGRISTTQLLSAKRLSDQAEHRRAIAAAARKTLPAFDQHDGDPTNTIIYDDATTALRHLQPASIDLVFTSPPYAILGKDYEAYQYDGDYDKYLSEMAERWALLHGLLRDGGRLVVNFDNPFVQQNEKTEVTPMRRNVFADFDHQLRKLGFKYRDTVVWHKGHATAFQPVARNDISAKNPKLSTTYEFLNVYSKGSLEMQPPAGGVSGDDLYDLTPEEWHAWRNEIWVVPPEKNKGDHICPFPMELAERVVRLFSFRGGTVLDPFVGSGTTAAAAAKWGRKFIGIDNDPVSVLAARNRVKEAVAAAVEMAQSAAPPPPPLTDEEKQRDIIRRLATVRKHAAAELKEAVLGKPRRNRAVGNTSVSEQVSPATQADPPSTDVQKPAN